MFLSGCRRLAHGRARLEPESLVRFAPARLAHLCFLRLF
jgi:hypothetical protein